MSISVFQLFSVGVGPSSSHTVGPMRAARLFASQLDLKKTEHVKVDLYGSLALTSKGHGTDIAILLGLSGETPQDTNPNLIQSRIQTIRDTHQLKLMGEKPIPFKESTDLIFHMDKQLPYHPNGMRFEAFDA